MAANPPTIVTRLGKTAPLTAQEMDDNLTNLKAYSLAVETEIANGTTTFSADAISGDSVDGGTISNFASTGIDDNAASTALTIDSSGNSTFGGNVILSTASATVDGRDLTADGAVLDAATNANTASTIVKRDGNGDFSAGKATADLVGDVYASNGTSSILDSGTNGSDATFTGNVTGDLTGAVTATGTLSDGVTATTQGAGDNSTKVATTAYVDAIEIFSSGMIMQFGGSTAPTGWLMCDGAAKDASSDSSLQPLFDVIGNAYGGSNNTDFKLPDLRGRMPVGAGTGTNLTARTLAAVGGAEEHSLTEAEMPPHTHETSFLNTDAPSNGQGYLCGSNNQTANYTYTSESTGGTNGTVEAHENMPPFVVLNFIIKI
tara:strand:+ start:2902 stop:4026 length:1125 start_codon:yes stop_codon:yes gene_type:complete